MIRAIFFTAFLFFSCSVFGSEGSLSIFSHHSRWIEEYNCDRVDWLPKKIGTKNLHWNTYGKPVYVSYFVTNSGSPSNNGLSEETAWSWKHAHKKAVAGDVVYIKAGEYFKDNPSKVNYAPIITQQYNDGTTTNPIEFIGYKETVGDIVPEDYSSFERTAKSALPSSTDYPTIVGSSNRLHQALQLFGDYVKYSNIYIQDTRIGVTVKGNHNILNNIITNNNSRAFHFYGNHGIYKNLFSLNATGEAFNIKYGSHNLLEKSVAWSDNVEDPGGYYFAVTFGGKNNIIQDNLAYRDLKADKHRGHGLTVKDIGKFNLFRRNILINTGIEVNFSGVTDNIFEYNRIYGHHSIGRNEFSATMAVINGARDNIFKNNYLEDVFYGAVFVDTNDGFVNTDDNIDRDELQGGNNNKFLNNIINGYYYGILFSSSGGHGNAPTSDNNIFANNTFYNGRGPVVATVATATNLRLVNNIFHKNIYPSFKSEFSGDQGVTKGRAEVIIENCNFSDVSFTLPKGINVTNHNPSFTYTGSEAALFTLSPDSRLKWLGKSLDYKTDFSGKDWGSRPDIGAFKHGEYKVLSSSSKINSKLRRIADGLLGLQSNKKE